MTSGEWIFRVERPVDDAVHEVRLPGGIMTRKQAEPALVALAARFQRLTSTEIVESFLRKGTKKRQRAALAVTGEMSTGRLMLMCGDNVACTGRFIAPQQRVEASEAKA
jgi:hypothetical protein